MTALELATAALGHSTLLLPHNSPLLLFVDAVLSEQESTLLETAEPKHPAPWTPDLPGGRTLPPETESAIRLYALHRAIYSLALATVYVRRPEADDPFYTSPEHDLHQAVAHLVAQLANTLAHP